MIEQKATIVELEDNIAWVQAERQSTCGQCAVRKGCGTGLLAKHVGKKFTRIAVPRTENMEPGQHVYVSIPEEALVQGAALMYLLPILFMFAAAVAIRSLGWGELAEISAGIVGLFAGFYWVRNKLKTHAVQLDTQIIEEK